MKVEIFTKGRCPLLLFAGIIHYRYDPFCGTRGLRLDIENSIHNVGAQQFKYVGIKP